MPTVAKFATVQKEGEREVTRNIEYYNLDVILSVGYRVKSDKGVIFRQWANKILKDYMLKGYALNQKRLEYLEKTIKLIDIANRIKRDKGLEYIIGNIYQSFAGQDIYKSIEEKAANFLYLIVKNHVFADGNKRIAATLFIYFLNFYGILYRENKQVIDNNTLTTLTLLIAESNPKEKEVIIDLVMNFLHNDSKRYSNSK
ncbi:MAG: virulence protein RhuM/Fic/DOC family protein [Clostridia bacterium]|nr:virulence protein RhuM/Fic/DOC family protein [Clostridia bacterium]